MTFLQTSTLSLDQKKEIITFWNRESPQHVTHNSIADFDQYLATLEDVTYTLVLDDTGHIVGWLGDFLRDAERWFAMLLDSSIQGRGIGSKLLTKVQERHEALNGWVIDHNNDKRLDGKPYPSPVSFYLKNDFKVIADVRLELPDLSCVKMRWQKGK